MVEKRDLRGIVREGYMLASDAFTLVFLLLEPHLIRGGVKGHVPRRSTWAMVQILTNCSE